jgi:hypothetical protein
MDEVEWTERHERMAQRLPSANADTDPELLATVLAHLRAGRLKGLAIARQEVCARSDGWRREFQAWLAFEAVRHEGSPQPKPTQANYLWWELLNLACEVFEPWIRRVARRPFSLRGVIHPSAHHVACDLYCDPAEEADELLAYVAHECEYEFEMMEALSVGMNRASVHPIDMMIARHAEAWDRVESTGSTTAAPVVVFEDRSIRLMDLLDKQPMSVAQAGRQLGGSPGQWRTLAAELKRGNARIVNAPELGRYVVRLTQHGKAELSKAKRRMLQLGG